MQKKRSCAIISFRDILILAPKGGQKCPQGGYNMKKYELALVLSSKLEDEERAAALEKVNGYIARFNGTVTNVDEWGKRKLAYEIQKQKEGFYYFITIETEESEFPNEMEARLRLQEFILRYLIVKPEED